MERLDGFTRALRDVCATDPLREKWVLAPSLRIAQQWIDRAALSGQPVLGAHAKTLRGVAIDIASPRLAASGRAFLGRTGSEVLLDGLFGRLRSSDKDALALLNPSSGLTEALHRTIRDIRLAGLCSRDVSAATVRAEKRGGLFEDGLKGEQVIKLLGWYEEELDSGGLIDYAGALRLAIDHLGADPKAAIGDALLVIPDVDVEGLRGLERGFWAAVPEENKLVLEADRPAEGPGAEARSDIELLRWLPRPGDAPAPKGDGSAKLFRASGEVNEVREVLRRCVGGGIPFDDIEIIHTDTGTYVPLIYEQLCRMEFEGDDDRPVTFEEGLHASFFRPGRALCAWASWVIDGYPQRTLVRMLQDGLLEVPGANEARFGQNRLGALLRSVPIREGRERYVPCIDTKISALKKRIGAPVDEEDGAASARRSNIERQVAGLTLLRPVVESLVAGSPAGGETQAGILRMAREFLDTRARCAGRLDEFAKKRLLTHVDQYVESLDEDTRVEGLDVLAWLHSLADESQVGGQGPTPGCLYVTNLGQGGHSGRRHTFIVGLDDRRFPGAGLQDPLLLDAERSAMSPELRTAGDSLERKVDGFHQLVARLRGQVTLSYSSRNLADDNEASYPAGVVASAYRLLSGEDSFEQELMEEWIGPPAAFAPLEEEECIDATEWWIWRTCVAEQGPRALDIVMTSFPHLESGRTAREKRDSDLFTEFDGYVPEAALDPEVNPALEGGRPISANRFQALARCPMDFFFTHVLRLKPPEEYAVDPSVWLDVATKGILLHSVFQRFLSALGKRGETADFDRQWAELKEILDDEVERVTAEIPPPLARVSEAGSAPLYAQAYFNDLAQMEKTAEIFLRAEAQGIGRGVPLYFEASIGFESHQQEGTALDTVEPVEVEVGAGEEAKRIRLRGGVDRVDLLAKTDEADLYAVWDYKTMGGSKYRVQGPFNMGRYLQGAIYPCIVERRLHETGDVGAKVVKFGYIFPTEYVHGEPIEWTASELADGDRMLWLLCELVQRGCFAFSDEPDDVDFSDCTEAFGDLDEAVEQVKAKLANTANEAMWPFRELRGL
ncbi:MAG TPA: PD-(D/E)XK nuclease family protein [Candidatus Anoxymicrobiaceae bacterium]